MLISHAKCFVTVSLPEAAGKDTSRKHTADDHSMMSSTQGMIAFLPLAIVCAYLLNLFLNGRKNSSKLAIDGNKNVTCHLRQSIKWTGSSPMRSHYVFT